MRAAKKPFHERHLARSGFGKPKASKLDSPADAVCGESGNGAVLGDEGKAAGGSHPGGFAVSYARVLQAVEFEERLSKLEKALEAR